MSHPYPPTTMNNSHDDEQRYQLWMQNDKGQMVKFELKDAPGGGVTLDMWQDLVRVFNLNFDSTSAFLELLHRLQRLGNEKLADEAKEAKLVYINKNKK